MELLKYSECRILKYSCRLIATYFSTSVLFFMRPKNSNKWLTGTNDTQKQNFQQQRYNKTDNIWNNVSSFTPPSLSDAIITVLQITLVRRMKSINGMGRLWEKTLVHGCAYTIIPNGIIVGLPGKKTVRNFVPYVGKCAENISDYFVQNRPYYQLCRKCSVVLVRSTDPVCKGFMKYVMQCRYSSPALLPRYGLQNVCLEWQYLYWQ